MSAMAEQLEQVKEILTKSSSIICKNLDPKPLLLTMKAKGALTPDDVTLIKKAEVTESDQAEQMLNILMKKPATAYDIFMEALLEAKRNDLYGGIKDIEMEVKSGIKPGPEPEPEQPANENQTDEMMKRDPSKASIDTSQTTADEEKVTYAVGCYVAAKSKGKESHDTAKCIVYEFDRKYKTTWHCIIGEGYSHFTESDPRCKIKFTIGGESLLLFRHTTRTEPKPSPNSYPHISLSDRKMISESKMEPEMEKHVIDCCRRACMSVDDTSNKERAKYIVNEFDNEHNGGWNCILGGSFVSCVRHPHNKYVRIMNFGKENFKILLFRC